VQEFLAVGEPAKSVTLIGEGPDGRSLRGDDPEVLRSFAAGWKYALPGFTVFGSEGRLWVFRDGSKGLDEYVATGEPAKSVTLIAAGPNGMSLRGEDKDALNDYAASFRWAMPGYAVYGAEGRLWVFRSGSKAHDEFLTSGEPAKSVTLIGAGPEGMTLRGAEREVLEAYAAPFRYGLPGYAVYASEGRLWVFREGSKAQAEFLASGEPAKSVTLIAAGPDGKTLRGDDKQVLEDFSASHRYASPGFAVFASEGRLWVFRAGSDALQEYLTAGEPAKSVTLIGAGPEGKTLRGDDKQVLRAYAAAWNQRS
jgi:hypothetical protein